MKLHAYQGLETIREILLIDSESYHAMVYRRADEHCAPERFVVAARFWTEGRLICGL